MAFLSITFGVALYTSIDVVNESTLKSFSSGIEAMSGKAAFSVMGGPSGFAESALSSVESIPGIASAVPVIETQAYFLRAGGESPDTLMVLGVDLLRESSIRAYRMTQNALLEDPLAFLNQPDSIILTREFATRHHLDTGSSIELSTASGKKKFVIRGMLTAEGPALAYGGNLAIMDIDAARVQFAKVGKLDRIDILPANGVKIRDLQSNLEKTLPQGLTVESPATQADQIRQLIEGYQGLLSFVGVLALIVGLFLVMNSMTISIAERRRELGILRALGAHRGFLMRHLLEEALILGFLGSLCGLFLGKWVAGLMVGHISLALSNQYLIPVFVDRLLWSSRLILKALILGTGTTLLAAWLAGRTGLDIEPIEAVRGHSKTPVSPGWLAPFAGTLLLGFIVIDSRLGWSQHHPWVRTLNPFCLIFGSVMVSPLWVRILIRALRFFIPLPAMRLSCDNLLRNSARTSSNLMTLMVGLMLVMVLSLLNGSIKHSVLTWFQKTLSADLVVSSTGKLLSFKVQPLHQSLILELNRLEGIDISDGIGATGLRYVKQRFQGKTLALKAFDQPHPRLKNALIEIKSGGDPDEVRSRFFMGLKPEILVSDNFVMHFGKTTGDTIELETPQGLRAFTIIGVVGEFTNPEGVIYMPRSQYRSLYQDDLVSGFFLMAKPGKTPETLRSEMDRKMGQRLGLMGTLNRDLNREAEKIIDESFTYTKAIEWSALLVGLFGLFNTLFVSVLERKREFGMLRAIGMTAKGLLFMILNESFIQGLLGGMVAIGIAVFVCYFWVIGTLSSLMGWVLRFSVPESALAKTFLAGIIVGVLAGVFPSVRAARIPIRESLES